jgi:glycerophosphoryl diester phosphodiesterase
MKINVILLIVLTPFISTCKKADLDSINNLNGNKILIIGHGGEGFQTGRHPVPTDSELSFTKAIEYHNADGCEMDVMLSKDSVLILFHDDELNLATDCHGCIPERNSEEILDCRYKQDFAVNNFQEEKIVSMEKILGKYIGSPYHPQFLLDIKINENCGKGTHEYINALVTKLNSLLSKYNEIEKKVFVHCANIQFLNLFKTLNPNFRFIVDMGSGSFDEGINIALQNGFYGVEVNNSYVTKAQIQNAHAQNLWVFVYGVKTRENHVEAVQKSPDGIETENIPLLQEILRK